MKLNYKKIGEGIPVIILHGLYGSSDNWISIAKNLSSEFSVYLIDLRNHGNSPHSDIFTIKAMSNDLYEFITDHNIDSFVLIGHSLGGKISMEFASVHPEKITKLIIVDIAPRNYTKEEFQERDNHNKIISTLKDVDLKKYKNRSEALEDLTRIDNSGRLKFFMMKNIKRTNDGKLEWKINLKAIPDNLSTILNDYNVDLSKITCPTLFIKGEKSGYLTQADFDMIAEKISDVMFSTIKEATHWLHAEKPEEFINIVKAFVN